MGNVNCWWLEGRMVAIECVAVGECGLDSLVKEAAIPAPSRNGPANKLHPLWLGPDIYHSSTEQTPQGIFSQFQCRTSQVSVLTLLFSRFAGVLFLYHYRMVWTRQISTSHPYQKYLPRLNRNSRDIPNPDLMGERWRGPNSLYDGLGAGYARRLGMKTGENVVKNPQCSP